MIRRTCPALRRLPADGVLVGAQLDEVAKGAGVGGDEDLGFGGVGEHGAGGLAGELAAEGFVGDVFELVLEALD